MARNGFKNGRPRGRRSEPARIVKQNLLRKVSSIFRLPMFTSGSSGSSFSGPLTCDSTLFTCDSTLITCDQTEV